MFSRYHLRKRKERSKQYLKSKSYSPIGDCRVHLITVNKKAYLKAAIRCANSIWFHSPEIRIVIHIDRNLYQFKDYLISKMDRKDRVEVCLEDSFDSWQELKLKVILNDLRDKDSFSDADLYWNSAVPSSASGIYFTLEKVLLNSEPYQGIIRESGVVIGGASAMINTSFIALGQMPDRGKFAEEVGLNFRRIRKEVLQGEYEENIRMKVLRLSEQIALSISINNNIDYFRALKSSDSPMDGGPAESYYLGTTKGWA